MGRLFLLISIQISASIIFGATINVPADQPAIQAGINAAVNGDSIIVAPGTYIENVDFNGKMVTVLSLDGPEVTIIQAADAASETISFTDDEPKGAEISGFTITGSNSTAIKCFSSSPAIINNIIRNNNTNRTYGCAGINLGNVDNVLISGNIIHSNIGNNYGGGIQFRGKCTNDTVSYNILYDNTGDFDIRFGDDRAHNCLVSNNTVISSTRYGIIHQSFGTLDVRNNIICFASVAGIQDDGTGSINANYNCTFSNESDYNFIPGVGNIYDDPHFEDTASKDYGLAVTSPCKNAGDPDPFFNDIDGSRNDIGALPILVDIPYVDKIMVGDGDILHVISHTPNIYWSYNDANFPQAAFEIEISTYLDWSVIDVWDSGIVSSSDTMIVFNGNTLYNSIQYNLRIRVFNGTIWGNWSEWQFRMNTNPSVPEIKYPTGGQNTSVMFTVLSVGNAIDIENDIIQYCFEVYDDEILSNIVYVEEFVSQQADSTSSSYIPGLTANQTYWWRARTFDGYEYSVWTDLQNFTPLDSKTIVVPNDAATIQEAIDRAFESDVILVNPGTYTENIDYSGKSIKILRATREATILQPADPNITVVNIANSENSYTEFKGFTVIGGSGEQVVLIANESSPTISDCTFKDYMGSGSVHSVIRVTSDAIIKNCLFYNNQGISCLSISDGGRADVLNNTFDRNNRGLNNSNGSSIVMNNIISNSIDYGFFGYFGSSLNLDYNCVYINGDNYGNLTSAPPNDINANPLYVDPSIGDYRLQESSPCIDRGNPLSEFNDPDHSRNDIGAIPFYSDYPFANNINLGEEDMDHVLEHIPVIYWSHIDPDYPQIEYEIELGADQDWAVAEKWKTGPIQSLDTSVLYGGTVLLDGYTYYMRIRLFNGLKWGEWSDRNFRMNTPPYTPLLIHPISGMVSSTLYTRLYVGNILDGESDTLQYFYELYDDELFSNLIYSEDSYYETPDSTGSSYITGLIDDQQYWWRAKAFDGFEYSSWSQLEAFITAGHRIINVPDDEVTIQGAIDQAYDGDIIEVRPGLYTENIDFKGKSIKILGVGRYVKTLQPADSIKTVINIANGENSFTEFSDFTVQGGYGQHIVFVDDESNPYITNCIFKNYTGNGPKATVIRVRSKATIENCLFYHNQGNSCISVSDSARAYIINNTFDNNNRGFHSLDSSSVIFNNIVTNSAEYGIYGFCNLSNYNCLYNNNPDYQGGAIPGLEDISVDPLFVSAQTGNYLLESESQCIDAGNPQLKYNDSDGTRNDMGANLIESAILCGDGNLDERVNVADAVFLVNCVFRGGVCPEVETGGDPNCDLIVNIADAVYLINHIFKGGEGPCATCK